MKKVHLQLLMALFGIFSLIYFVYVYKTSTEIRNWIIALWWPAIAAHQFEEYIMAEKIAGNKYFFLNWFYDNGYRVSYLRSFLINCIVSPAIIIILSVMVRNYDGWILIIPISLLSIEFANANWHISFLLQKNAYSPGSITGLLVYVPLSIYIYNFFIKYNYLNHLQLFIGVIFGYLLMYIGFRFLFPKRDHN